MELEGGWRGSRELQREAGAAVGREVVVTLTLVVAKEMERNMWAGGQRKQALPMG